MGLVLAGWLGVWIAVGGSVAMSYDVPVVAVSQVKGAQAPQLAPLQTQPSPSDLRDALLARLQFQELKLELCGIASFQGQKTCFLRVPGAGTEQLVYNEGDVIDGFQVAQITADSVMFDRGGRQFWLNLGENEPQGDEASMAVAEATDPPQAAQGDFDTAQGEELAQLVIKQATPGVKTKTERFETAKVVEDGSDTRPLYSTASSSRRAVASTMFINPLRGQGAKLTSGYGYRRHPMGYGRRFHKGIDLAAPYGSPVYAAADGTVTVVRRSSLYGRYIMIRHANGYETRYAHLSKQTVSVGDRVSQGERIGLEGSSGRSTGPPPSLRNHQKRGDGQPRTIHTDSLTQGAVSQKRRLLIIDANPILP